MHREPLPLANPEDQAPAREGAPLCDLCAAPMVAVHCKLRCETCGFTRDCSDP